MSRKTKIIIGMLIALIMLVIGHTNCGEQFAIYKDPPIGHQGWDAVPSDDCAWLDTSKIYLPLIYGINENKDYGFIYLDGGEVNGSEHITILNTMGLFLPFNCSSYVNFR